VRSFSLPDSRSPGTSMILSATPRGVDTPSPSTSPGVVLKRITASYVAGAA
jgi:hypothetical protein